MDVPDSGLDGLAVCLGLLYWFGPMIAGLIGASMGMELVKKTFGSLLRSDHKLES